MSQTHSSLSLKARMFSPGHGVNGQVAQPVSFTIKDRSA